MIKEWIVDRMKGVGSFLFIFLLSIQIFLLFPLAIALEVTDPVFGNPLIVIGMTGIGVFYAIGISKVFGEPKEFVIAFLYILLVVTICILANITNLWVRLGFS